MFRQAPPPLSIPLSHLIASDAPLLSPVDASSESAAPGAFFSADPSLSYEHYPAPYSPWSEGTPGPLKLRASPEASSDAESRCMPTHQLFELGSASEDSPPPEYPPAKRPSVDCGSGAPKKQRAERVSTKDFIPPDVSGLSKREARLVKNRAAAFLSRQRKREEFECMEVRVAELEQENAMLRGATTSITSTDAPEVLMSEIEQLRAQLAAAEQRSAELKARLQNTSDAPAPLIKPEPVEHVLPAPAPTRSRSSSVASQKPERSGASLGLMVLLCALPTLLSLPTHGSSPARFSLPFSPSLSHSLLPAPGALNRGYSLDRIHSLDDGEFDYASAFTGMDVDSDMIFSLPEPTDAFAAPPAPSASAQTLAFADGEALGLGALDISFDARPAEDGKIRVRIHPGADAGTRASSPFAVSMPGAFPLGGPTATSDADDALGPFLGVGDEPMLFDSYDPHGRHSLSPPPGSASRRRVRIALKSMPTSGGEGGEWEVEVC